VPLPRLDRLGDLALHEPMRTIHHANREVVVPGKARRPPAAPLFCAATNRTAQKSAAIETLRLNMGA
jgi:hypothetical protein